jgi:Putative metal-binding domain of cation transport ATPase
MATVESKKECDLCGLTVEISGFTLKTQEGDKLFCCEGCKGIYQMLHAAQILPENEDAKLN